jgi:3-oxoadipate enol-lactonase
VTLDARGEIFVREAGGGARTIALLHGWTASADLNWFRTYGEVARMGRMVAMDHRGHGRGLRSEEPFSLEDAADDVAALLRTLDAAPAVLVGYSMGGPIALLTWLRHPDVVEGLVLAATALEWRATSRERLLWRLMAVAEYFLRMGQPRGLVERALREIVEESPDLEPALGWLRGELRRGDPEALADAGRALGQYDFRPHAPGVTVPTAVVVTTADRLVRPRKQRALGRVLPDSAVFEFAGDHDAAIRAGFVDVLRDALASVLDRLAAQERGRTAG